MQSSVFLLMSKHIFFPVGGLKGFFFAILFVVISPSSLFAQQQESKEVLFDFNSYQLSSAAQKTLGSVVVFCMGNRKVKRIEVNGFADTSGSWDYNLNLSDLRAETVKNYLLTHGLQSQSPKILVNFYGENRSRGRSVERQRAVVIKIYFALPDRDTILRLGCVSIKIPANTFGNFNINELDLNVRYAGDAQSARENGLVMQDENGNTLLSNGMVKLDVSYRGKPVKAENEIEFTLPELNNRADYAVYSGYQENGVVKWKKTDEKMERINGNENGAECASFYSFRSSDVNSWKNVDKVDNCVCSQDGFGGIQTPGDDADHAVEGDRGSLILAQDLKSDLKKKAHRETEFLDLRSKEEMMSYCEQLANPAFLQLPTFKKLKVEPMAYFEMKSLDKENRTDQFSADPNSHLVAIPKSAASDENGVGLVCGTKLNGKFSKWNHRLYRPSKCLGLINCDYVVFEVPLNAYYTLVSVEKEEPVKKDSRRRPNTVVQKPLTVKVKKQKNPGTFFADVQGQTVLTTANSSFDKYTISTSSLQSKSEASGKILIVKVTNGKDVYGYIQHAEKVRYRKNKNQFVVRKLKKYSGEKWAAEIKKYCSS